MSKKINSKCKRILIDLIVFISFALILFIAHYIVYSADVSTNVTQIFGFNSRFPLIEIALWFAGSGLLIGIITLVLEKDKSKKKSKKQKIKNVFAIIGAIAIIILSGWYVSVSGIGYYEDHIKFKCDGGYIFKVCQADYEDIEIYKLDGYYYSVPKAGYKDENYYSYYEYKDDAYAIASGDKYVELGRVKPNSIDSKMIDKIISEYDKKIIEIQSVKEIKQ